MGQVGFGNLRGLCRLSKMGSMTRQSNIGKAYNSDSGVRQEPIDKQTRPACEVPTERECSKVFPNIFSPGGLKHILGSLCCSLVQGCV